MQLQAELSRHAAKAAIRYNLPDLVYQYLQFVGRDREWIAAFDIAKHFNLGPRQTAISDGLKRLHDNGPKRLLDPNLISESPIFVLQMKKRWHTSSRKNVRVFLVERNHFYRPSRS